ncbi:hypothetical protein GZ77_17330 [Endozoicomonas montiporae]|uniref:Autotransporter domain-containing protein n=2 Tax=Endozoicomonas montiporae TaxID=1027273 RepID=A0A081N1J8_9GAMM|nr:autotransporter outer membrane beta-barrel domain-containing protein [Endozoicomonas montiporae]AMO58748.1 autotransporter [Endozoicomonas montiporae CL-33]KEQ12321.1 hypothetical protein GZ77_17330 [Endozoicomonas montiporae]
MFSGTSLRTKCLVRTALSTAAFLAVTSPVNATNLSQGSVPYKLAVNDSSVIIVSEDLTATGGDAVITLNAMSGGIHIQQGNTIDANPGPFGSSLNPSSATVFIDESGTLTGTLKNEGEILDGVFISGKSIHQSGTAYWSLGQDAGNQADLQGGYVVLEGGVTEVMNDHAVLIDDHSSIDFVVANGALMSLGNGSAAVHVTENAQISDGFVINGTLSAPQGRGIDIAGTANGDLGISSSGVLSGAGGGMSAGAALLVSGSYTGLLDNDGDIEGGIFISGSYTGTFDNDGDIKGGIFISGTHEATQGAAYHAQGSLNDPATLSGGYTTVDGGVSRSTNDHTIYLDDNSITDFVVVMGQKSVTELSTIEATASDKSAVYVENGAQLGGFAGRTDSDAAIIVKDGGTIKATGADSSAITVRGDLTGKIHVDNGFITAASATDVALDFTTSNKPMMFEQIGDNAKTTGIISASAQHLNDWAAFRGGSYEGETIQNVDHLVVSTITKGITMSGNFTLPAQTTIELVKQQQLDDQGQGVTDNNNNPVYELNSNALMTVSGRLNAMEAGSNIQFKPASATEYKLMKSGALLTLVDPGSIDGGLAGRVTVDSGSFLIEATEVVSSAGTLQVQIKSRDAASVKQSVMKSGAGSRASEVLGNAVDVINAASYADATKGNKLFAKLNSTNYDVKKLSEQVQPRVAGEVQKSAQGVANTAHNIVFNRIHGLRRGISYGDQFVDGSVWGQMLYNSGKQSKVDNEHGFDSQTWGITLGADAEIDPAVRMGLAVSLVRSTVDGKDGSTNKNYGYLGTWYNSWNARGYFVDTMLSMGNTLNDMTKTVDGYRIKADFEVDQWGVRVIGGNNWRIGNWTISPQTEFNYGLIRVQDYDEKGDSGFEQKIQSKDYNTWELGGGMKFNGEYWFRRGVIKPELTFMGYYDFGTDGVTVKSTYLAGGNSFIVTGPDRDKIRLHMGLGLGLQLNNSWTFQTGYNYNWKKNFHSHSFTAKARYEF